MVALGKDLDRIYRINRIGKLAGLARWAVVGGLDCGAVGRDLDRICRIGWLNGQVRRLAVSGPVFWVAGPAVDRMGWPDGGGR
jgi:hypothetical protein